MFSFLSQILGASLLASLIVVGIMCFLCRALFAVEPVTHPPSKKDDARRNSEVVTLNVRGKLIFTTVGALVARNNFFEDYLSGHWRTPEDDNGQIFLDVNPDIFLHLLAFFSSGIFPVVYDAAKGHDHKLYLDILAQARYFAAPELEAWLKHQCYYRAIDLRTTMTLVDSFKTPGETQVFDESCDTMRTLLAKTEGARRYDCDSGVCSRRCVHCSSNLSQGSYQTTATNSYVNVSKRVCFNDGWCSTDSDNWKAFWDRGCRDQEPEEEAPVSDYVEPPMSDYAEPPVSEDHDPAPEYAESHYGW